MADIVVLTIIVTVQFFRLLRLLFIHSLCPPHRCILHFVVIFSLSLKEQLHPKEVPTLFVSVCGTSEG